MSLRLSVLSPLLEGRHEGPAETWLNLVVKGTRQPQNLPELLVYTVRAGEHFKRSAMDESENDEQLVQPRDRPLCMPLNSKRLKAVHVATPNSQSNGSAY